MQRLLFTCMNFTETKNRNSKEQTLASIIFKNLVISLILVVGGLILIYSCASKIETNFWNRTDISYLLSQKKRLKKGAYDKLNIGGGFRFSGYFEIVDEDARILYCSDKRKKNTYNKQALSFIPDSRLGESFYMEEITDDKNAEFLISRYITEDDDTEEISGIMLIDGEGYIYYNSTGMDAEKLNKKTLEILKKNTDRTFLQKSRFSADDGENLYLLYHFGNRSRIYHSLKERVEAWSIAAAILLAVFSILFFCRRILNAIRQPMGTLMERIETFGENRNLHVPDTNDPDPVEFRRILASFDALERELTDSENEKQELEDQKQKMLTDISHDLKTPATVIQGYAQILSSGAASREEQQQYLEIIRKRSVQLSDLIHTFYEYNKLNHPELRLDLKEDDFCEFFREFFADRYEELYTQGSTITADIPEETMMLSFDHQLMKRLLENILGNSIRHNGGHTDLYAGLSRTDREIIVRIGDNGAGISEDLRESVFSPFVTGNKARTGGEGSGLGLAIAMRIAELHRGTIRLLPENTDGWKVLFEIRLPGEDNDKEIIS